MNVNDEQVRVTKGASLSTWRKDRRFIAIQWHISWRHSVGTAGKYVQFWSGYLPHTNLESYRNIDLIYFHVTTFCRWKAKMKQLCS